MKKKNFNQKLSLKKVTVTNLNMDGMINAKGGVQPTHTFCGTQICPQLERDLSEMNGTRCWAGTINCEI